MRLDRTPSSRWDQAIETVALFWSMAMLAVVFSPIWLWLGLSDAVSGVRLEGIRYFTLERAFTVMRFIGFFALGVSLLMLMRLWGSGEDEPWIRP